MPSHAAKLSRLDPASLATNPRATLAAWKLYEPHIKKAYRCYPQPYIITPTTFSAETFVSRIRDAIRGKLAFDYPSELTTEQVSQWYSEIIVKRIDKSVYIGPKEKLTLNLGDVVEKSSAPVFDTLTEAELAAFALLLSNGRISGPFLIRNPPPLDSLPSFPNFQALPRPDGSLVLI